MNNHDQQILKIERLPAQIKALVADLTAAQLTTRYLPAEWTVAQNVHHLFDSHANSYLRCKLIVTEHNPPLKGYDQDVWAARPDACGPEISGSLAALTGLHMRWVTFWRGLADTDYERVGIHSENGAVRLDDLLALYSGHGESHIDQIRRTLAAGGIVR